MSGMVFVACYRYINRKGNDALYFQLTTTPPMSFQMLSVNLSMFLPVLVSAGLSGGIVLTKNWHGKFSLDTHEGAQKFHVAPTPRIGGIALFAAVISAWLVSGEEAHDLLGLMILAGLPAFFAGLFEDFTKRGGVRERLISTMFSGMLASVFTGYRLTHIDVPLIDSLLLFYPLSLAFTSFAVGGVANAVNIIDGFNGLASSVLMICFATMGLISWQVGDMTMVTICLLFTLSVAGFLIVNFPYGIIFMGDGGAYLMGYLLSWTAVMLPMRNHEVSPWTSIVVCAYPIIETLFSIMRKIYRKGHHPGRPDRVHFHMLIYQRLSRAIFFGREVSLINGLTTIFILPFPLMCGILATYCYSSTIQLFICFIFLSLIYYFAYLRLTQFRWCIKPEKRKPH